MSDRINRLKELGSRYTPRVKEGQSVSEFTKEELEKNGITLAQFKASDYFKDGGFAKVGALEKKIAEELGYSDKGDADEAHAASQEKEDEEDTKKEKTKKEEKDEKGVHAATGDEFDRKHPLKVAEYAEHDAGNLTARLKKAEDDNDEAEVKRLTKLLEDAQHEAGKGLADMPQYNAASEMRPEPESPIEDDMLKEVEKPADGQGQMGEPMIYLSNVAPAMKVPLAPYGKAMRVVGNDVSDLRPVYALRPKTQEEQAWNFVVGRYVRAILNVLPPKTIEIPETNFSSIGPDTSKAIITDPDSDSINLVKDLGNTDANNREVLRMYAQLNSTDIAAARQAGRIRIEADFTGLPTGSGVAFANNQAKLSGSMYETAGTVVMSQERAAIINCGLRQFRKRLISPRQFKRLYGKSAGTTQLEDQTDAIFTQREVAFYGMEMPAFPITEDMSYCILKGFGNRARAIRDFSIRGWLARDPDEGPAILEESYAATIEGIPAFAASQDVEPSENISKKAGAAILNAMSHLTKDEAAEWATASVRYEAGGAYQQLETTVDETTYSKAIAPYCCIALMILNFFLMFTEDTKIMLINGAFRPFVGNMTPELRSYVLSPVSKVNEFVNEAIAKMHRQGSGISSRMREVEMRRILTSTYNLIYKIINPRLNTRPGPGLAQDGRFFTFKPDRTPTLENGTRPPMGTPLSDLYGSRVFQKGFPINGNYWNRDSEVIMRTNLRNYEKDLTLFSEYTVMIKEESFNDNFAPFSMLFNQYLTLLSQVLPRIEKNELTLFQFYHSDLTEMKGGGLMNMSLAAMRVQAVDSVMPAGQNYIGIRRYSYDKVRGVQTNMGVRQVPFYGALAFMRWGIMPVVVEEINKFKGFEKVIQGDVGSRYEMNIQMAIYIANDVMEAACNDTLFTMLTKRGMTRFMVGGNVAAGRQGRNIFYLENYEKDCLKAVEIICRCYYKAGSMVEKFALDWVRNRNSNKEKAIGKLYFDNEQFHDQYGNTMLSLYNMRNVDGTKISRPNAIGYAFTMPTETTGRNFGTGFDSRGLYEPGVTSTQIPYRTYAQPVAATEMLLGKKKVGVASNPWLAPDITLNAEKPVLQLSPRTCMGLQESYQNDYYRYMLIAKRPLLPSDFYGHRIYDTPNGKFAMYKDDVSAGTRTPVVPFDSSPLRNASMPKELRDTHIRVAPEMVTIVGKRDFQEFKRQGSDVLFNALNFAAWTRNTKVVDKIDEAILLQYMEGGFVMDSLPTEAALIAKGVSRRLASYVSTAPTMAYFLGDMKRLASTVFNTGGGTMGSRPYMATPGFENVYGNGYLQFMTRKMNHQNAIPSLADPLAVQRFGPQGAMNLVSDPGMMGAYNLVGGSDRDFCGSMNYYQRNQALATTMLSGMAAGSSFESRDFIMIKTKVKRTMVELKEGSRFQVVAAPAVTVTTKEFYRALAGVDSQRNVDAYDIPLEATKIISEGEIKTAWVSTDTAYVPNVISHAMTSNPNVDEIGRFVNPLTRSRREQPIVGVVGTDVSQYRDVAVHDRRINVITGEMANEKTSGRDGSNVILAPGTYPIPNATLGGAGMPAMPSYIQGGSGFGVRCFSVFDFENELDLLEVRSAIPVITPNKVTIMPFKFAEPVIRATQLEL
jgi:hypothetical protein